MRRDRNKFQASVVLAVLAVAQAILAIGFEKYAFLGIAGALMAASAITYANSKTDE